MSWSMPHGVYDQPTIVDQDGGHTRVVAVSGLIALDASGKLPE